VHACTVLLLVCFGVSVAYKLPPVYRITHSKTCEALKERFYAVWSDAGHLLE
jgi:hypothetical protein